MLIDGQLVLTLRHARTTHSEKWHLHYWECEVQAPDGSLALADPSSTRYDENKILVRYPSQFRQGKPAKRQVDPGRYEVRWFGRGLVAKPEMRMELSERVPLVTAAYRVSPDGWVSQG